MAVAAIVAVDLAVGDAVAVGLSVGEAVAVAVDVAVAVAVGVNVGAAVAVDVGKAVGGDVDVNVGADVGVSVGMGAVVAVSTASGVAVAESVGVAPAGSASISAAMSEGKSPCTSSCTTVKERDVVTVIPKSVDSSLSVGPKVGVATLNVAVINTAKLAAPESSGGSGDGVLLGGVLFTNGGAAIHELGSKIMNKISSAKMANMEIPPIIRQRPGRLGNGFVSSKTR